MKMNKLMAALVMTMGVASFGANAANGGAGKVTFTGSIVDAPCSITPGTSEQEVKLGQVSQGVLKAQFRQHRIAALHSRYYIFFRNDSVDTLLEKLDALWHRWPMNNHARSVHEYNPCGECLLQRLSYSEKKVIRYIGLGFIVSHISSMLQKNVKTVSSQKRSAMRKLNMSRNIELYRFLTHSELM